MQHIYRRREQYATGDAGLTQSLGALGAQEADDWRDAPWLYSPGDYPGDHSAFQRRLEDRAALVLGDIRHMFREWLSGEHRAPIGFISIDVDYYSSTVGVLDGIASCSAERSYRSPQFIWTTSCALACLAAQVNWLPLKSSTETTRLVSSTGPIGCVSSGPTEKLNG